MIRVCFVCLGNICRSPTAEAVLRHLAYERGLGEEIEVESAGTAAYHQGEPADRRSVAAARAQGIIVDGRARQFVASDFERFDYVLALDEANLANLERLRKKESKARLELLLHYDPESAPGSGVPDPYYGGESGFEHVIDLCRRACAGLLDHIERQHRLGRRWTPS